jgi:hypothetical protein
LIDFVFVVHVSAVLGCVIMQLSLTEFHCSLFFVIFSQHSFIVSSQAIVALSGAHAVGRCHTDRSGYWGPWTYGETTFSNDYFCRLVDASEGWAPKTQHKGKRWTGPPQFVNSKGDLMMLHTDMALTWDEDFKKWVDIYANDEERYFKDFAKYYQRKKKKKGGGGGGGRERCIGGTCWRRPWFFCFFMSDCYFFFFMFFAKNVCSRIKRIGLQKFERWWQSLCFLWSKRLSTSYFFRGWKGKKMVTGWWCLGRGRCFVCLCTNN